MGSHTELAQRLSSWLSYLISGGLVISDAMQWLNQNAAGVGALMAIATFGINWYYQHKRATTQPGHSDEG